MGVIYIYDDKNEMTQKRSRCLSPFLSFPLKSFKFSPTQLASSGQMGESELTILNKERGFLINKEMGGEEGDWRMG